jgi:hypothetical protein
MTENLPALTDPIASTLALIERMAVNKDVDADKMGKLLDLQVKVMDRQAEMDFNQAFARLVPKLPRIKKDGSVEYKGKEAFKFATYENIDEIIRPFLLEEGFSLSFTTEPLASGGLIGHGKLMHVGGHSVKASMPAPVDTSGGKNAIQGMASTFSYLKRYLTIMLLNLVFEGSDDDGNRGGMVFIDDKSIKTIDDLLEETKADKARFLQMMEVAEVSNILAKDYPMAVNALIAKRNKIGATK